MEMACGADEIAAMLSDVVEGISGLGIRIDDIPGAVEDSKTMTSTDTLSSTVTGFEKGALYKSKEELTEAVKKKKESIRRVFKMMRYAEEVSHCH